eukprot:TRINITY_DN2633_c0_g1_i1.p1 TRINITY_DN2633_c0_g1~~TRINITY_DN2633_c0_g1_i1.p1  ORF type:complete len:253 (+),score=67.20 TRINITY_DN2633_c0_g1_i1:236-994(+)
MKQSSFILSLSLLLLANVASGQNCPDTYKDPILLSCGIFKDSKGREYDLKGLKTVAPIDAPDSATGGYIWQMCGAVTNAGTVCGGDPCAAACFVTSPSPITEIAAQKLVDLDPTAGSEGFTISSAPYNTLVTYATINVICDASAPTPGTPGTASLSFDNTHVTINYKSQSGCSLGGKGGKMSAGSIILIIFWSVLISYFVFGVAINKFYLHKSGPEVVPNHSFWFGLPGLIRDGSRFIVIKATGKETTYQTV